MPENPEGQERTEEPTPKRLQEARDRGQVAKSLDVTSSLILLLGTLVLFLFGNYLSTNLQNFFRQIFQTMSKISLNNEESINDFLRNTVETTGLIIFPVIVLIFFVALVGEIAQVGVRIAPKKFTEGVDFKKIFNPLPGIRRIFFSKRTLVELFKSFFKMFIIFGVIYWILSGKLEKFILLPSLPISEISSFMFDITFELTYKVAIAYILIAVADFAYQKYQYREDLKMTKQEVKEEHRQTEGDVLIKSRLRAIARDRLRKILRERVKNADVVITNPTHIAVALQYKPETMDAPVVVAKGVDYLAEKIIEIARQAGVPIVRNPTVAQTLYRLVPVDHVIPVSLYRAIAEILAFVYSQQHKSWSN